MICLILSRRYAVHLADAAVSTCPPLSTRIRLSCHFDEGRADDIGDGERLDAGHFPKPDFFAARKTFRIDGGFIVGGFLPRRDLEDVGSRRRADNIRLT